MRPLKSAQKWAGSLPCTTLICGAWLWRLLIFTASMADAAFSSTPALRPCQKYTKQSARPRLCNADASAPSGQGKCVGSTVGGQEASHARWCNRTAAHRHRRRRIGRTAPWALPPGRKSQRHSQGCSAPGSPWNPHHQQRTNAMPSTRQMVSVPLPSSTMRSLGA